MHYVTRWKMNAALMWLKEGDASHADIASRLGYESEAAFRRAFKRFTGQPPGAFRRQRPAAKAIDSGYESSGWSGATRALNGRQAK